MDWTFIKIILKAFIINRVVTMRTEFLKEIKWSRASSDFLCVFHIVCFAVFLWNKYERSKQKQTISERLVENNGIEPLTFWLAVKRSD